MFFNFIQTMMLKSPMGMSQKSMYVWLLVSSQKGGHWKRGPRCLSRPEVDYPWKGKIGMRPFHWNLWKISYSEVYIATKYTIGLFKKSTPPPSLMDLHVSWPTPTHTSGNTRPLSHLDFPCKRAPLPPEFPGFSRLLGLNLIYIQKNTCITQSHQIDVIE